MGEWMNKGRRKWNSHAPRVYPVANVRTARLTLLKKVEVMEQGTQDAIIHNLQKRVPWSKEVRGGRGRRERTRYFIETEGIIQNAVCSSKSNPASPLPVVSNKLINYSSLVIPLLQPQYPSLSQLFSGKRTSRSLT
jgi:hypothetical protein